MNILDVVPWFVVRLVGLGGEVQGDVEEYLTQARM